MKQYWRNNQTLEVKTPMRDLSRLLFGNVRRADSGETLKKRKCDTWAERYLFNADFEVVFTQGPRWSQVPSSGFSRNILHSNNILELNLYRVTRKSIRLNEADISAKLEAKPCSNHTLVWWVLMYLVLSEPFTAAFVIIVNNWLIHTQIFTESNLIVRRFSE